jgi:hypothetical protein
MNPKNCPDNCRFSVPVSNDHHPTLESSNVWWVFDLVNNHQFGFSNISKIRKLWVLDI